MVTYADIILPVPLQGLFTYTLPDHLASQAQAGCRVIVPFGNKRTATGIIARIHQTPPADPSIVVKEVVEMVDAHPVILPHQLSLWQWMADYYLCSIGEVFKAAVPGKLKERPTPDPSRKGGESSGFKEDDTAPAFPSLTGGVRGGSLPLLSPAQSTAIDSIRMAWREHAVCLLHGVTSSGKTEIYMHLIAEAISQGQQVLYLLPEIVLTSQLTDRLQTVFGERLGVYHSKFTDKVRAEVWQRQLTSAPYDIIVGVRSSVFLPFQRLGLVIVDEEHEVNFKQQDPAPRYHARNVAIMMAARAGARVLLGTATPSFESYYNARTGKYGLVRLSERFGQVALPEVEIVDTKELRRKRLMRGVFSPPLLERMNQSLSAGQQVILFQNLRGYAPHITCHVCGWVPRCPHCDVSLVKHAADGRMTCHYCGWSTSIPEQCPNCGDTQLRSHGYGTERIEDEVRKVFPEARVARMDMDTTRTRRAYEDIIKRFARGETDILVGTQMVTKGLDFENVSVVGILSADTLLNQSDFRAYERSFQMLSQVAGRAGRRSQRGHVLLQTMSAHLPLLQQVVTDDFEAMYREQMAERRNFAYPPFTRLIFVYVRHRHQADVELLAREAALRLRQVLGTRVLGPDEPPVARIAGQYLRRMMLKLEPQLPLGRVKAMLRQVRQELLTIKTFTSAHIYFDVDPL
ncbi:MAG: primosomal protein N' [Bacteroidaceae bacterium]|nr:primosomal protein N' [Bacteroidaceae bacterium]